MLIVDDDTEELKEVYGVNESELLDGPFTFHPSVYSLSAYEQGPGCASSVLLMQYASLLYA
jgi:hypothetical protein